MAQQNNQNQKGRDEQRGGQWQEGRNQSGSDRGFGGIDSGRKKDTTNLGGKSKDMGSSSKADESVRGAPSRNQSSR